MLLTTWSYLLYHKDQRAQKDHDKREPDPRFFCFRLADRIHCIENLLVGSDQKRNEKRKDKNKIIEYQVGETCPELMLVMQKSENKKIRPAGAREFKQSDNDTENKCRRQRRLFHKHRDPSVRKIRDF